MMGKSTALRIAAIATAWMPTAALACEKTYSSPRQKPCDEGGAITLGAAYTADIFRNDGGQQSGWRYMDNFDLTLEADLEKAVGWKGATAKLYVLYNNGTSLTELTGDAQAASNIETGVQALRLYEAWINQSIGEHINLKLGLYDLNSEFDALDAASLFIGSAHGIGTDIAQSGENGPSIFPSTSLSARLSVDVTDTLTVRVAALDGAPGNPNRPSRTSISLRDGALIIGEADWRSGRLRILAGAWTYTDRQDRLTTNDTASSNGAYVRGEACLDAAADCSVAIFGRIGVASGDVNPFELFASSGIVYAPAPDWEMGVAVAHAQASQPGLLSGEVSRSETVFEATAEYVVTDWFALQPNIQYVINPAVADTARDALAVGMRMSFSF